jgi:hypothetical protein
MPPRRKNKPKSTAVATAAPENDVTIKYPNRKYSEQEKEAVYAEFHNMKNNVDVCSFITKETTNDSRSKIFGKQRGSVKKAVEHVIARENRRRHTKNLTPIIMLTLTASELEEAMCRLPTPYPQDISKVDFVLSHLGELAKFQYHLAFAENVKEMIISYYNPVENTLLVPYPLNNRTRIQDFAAQLRTYWDESNFKKSKGTMNSWKKEILQHLGFVDDNNKHGHLAHVDKLREFKELHGHCFPPQKGEWLGLEYNQLYMFLYYLRKKNNDGVYETYENIHAEVKSALEEIGFDPHVTRSAFIVASRDQEMIVKLESFHKKHDHTWVPHPARNPSWSDLYKWIVDVRLRVNNPTEDGVIPLAEDIQRRLDEIDFVKDPLSHHGKNRIEHRHYLYVEKEFKKMNFVPSWNVIDKPHTNDKRKRRPDRVLYQSSLKKGDRMIIDEFDECGHDDRTKESEQRKVYHQCAYFLYEEEEVVDIHLLRVNGGYNKMANEAQARKHAEMIKEIVNRPFPDKPTITVHMLDFERDHHHVKAYQARLVPQSDVIERATQEDEWNSKPMYDNVLLYWT